MTTEPHGDAIAASAALEGGADTPSARGRVQELEDRLAECERLIISLSSRLSVVEDGRQGQPSKGKFPLRGLVLWIGLILLFLAIWQFVSPK